ncbi:MAG: PQQ-binding-like beta-propeller repeat protein [Chloracidobacterium sp.]|nr:PQQ-binding-like beta-propeller repeat protein [Chloracidobacterium sp.]
MLRTTLPKALISWLVIALAAVSIVAQVDNNSGADVTRCWAIPITAAVRRLTADGSRAYAALDGGRLISFSPDGKTTWSTELGGDISSTLLVTDTGLLLSTSSVGENEMGILRAISRDTGIVAATAPLPEGARYYTFALNGSVLVVSGNGIVQMIDRQGVVKWRREIAEAFAAVPVLGADRLFLASTGKQLFAIDPTSGEIDSVRKVKYDITALGVTQAGMLLVGDARGGLTAFDRSGATAWRFRTGGRVSGLFAANGHIFAMSHDNFVYCIDASNGSVAWKRRLAGRVSHAAPINGTYLFTTSLDEHGAAITAIAKGRTAGHIGLADDEFVTADPVISGGILAIGTNDAVYGYSLVGPAGCPK